MIIQMKDKKTKKSLTYGHKEHIIHYELDTDKFNELLFNIVMKDYAKKYGITDAIMVFGNEAINVLGESL